MPSTTRHELITEQEMSDLREIDVLLDEANTHAMTLGDGGWKSSEGHVSVSFGNHWERDPDEPRQPAKVEVYSYLLGPHRSHYFDSTAQALEVVKQWHRSEMSFDYATEVEGSSEPDLYLEIERQRSEDMAEAFRHFDEMGYGDLDDGSGSTGQESSSALAQDPITKGG